MQNLAERERLHKMLGDEPICAWFVLAKCAAGFAVVILLCVMSPREARVMDGVMVENSVGRATAGNRMNAAQHRKQVFTERHERFNGDAGQRSVVSEAGGQFAIGR